MPSRALATSNVVQFILRNGVVLGTFAGVNDFGGLGREPEQFAVDQGVINDDIGAAEQFRAAQSEQAGIARPRADQINCALWISFSKL